ncbi:unnamed protein product [Bursaphelenchus xylophilus]|uniref:(pine wood nematode) hypothetical protein n=1 Tax=Bursaphelenchus xylophilus TaxID=6326 RepID=A0A1I7RTS8_BURXY|nr:unnamed protein product [Bursaphelenchus xylophilus]CAG9122148.1 unnamed protein product [Bursaphelenchus xylophilus]
MALNLALWLFLLQLSRVFAPFPVVELLFDPHKEPDGLVEEWHKLITVQKNQTAKFGQEFPVDDRLYGNLKKCGHLFGPPADSTSFIKVHDIEIYSEIGHGTTFCRPGISMVRKPNETVDLSRDAQVFRHQCLNSMQTQSQNPSLAKIFRLMGAKIEVFESNVAHNSILSWTRHIIRMIKRTEGYEDRWKFFLIIPNAFDIQFGRGIHIIADDILQSIQLLHSEFRSKTFVTVVRNRDLTLHKVAAEKFFFCQKLLDLWNIDEISGHGAWNTLENRIKRNYQQEHFYVELLDVLDGTKPVYYDRIPDVSILDSDCVHFSARGLSLLHGHIWNQLVEPGTRQKKWKPIVNPFFCPRPHCPYLITNENARYCLRPKQYSFETKPRPKLLTALFLIMIMVLFIVLFTYTLCL